MENPTLSNLVKLREWLIKRESTLACNGLVDDGCAIAYVHTTFIRKQFDLALLPTPWEAPK